MIVNSLQDILPLVEQPSRYLGTEINRVQKDPGDVTLYFALAFPDLYEIGASHFGMQILYDILNRSPWIAAERVFVPGPDMDQYLREARYPLCSLESRRPLNRFDIIGFSLLYELNYTGILQMLDLSGIPFYARHRDLSFPLIIAGGPCTCNPEPVADFFDAMVVGDGEIVIMQIAQTYREWRQSGSKDKESLLRMWSKIAGVYVPSFFEPGWNAGGFQMLSPCFDDYRTVRRAIIEDLDLALFPTSPIVPYGKPVHDRLRLEVSRGCTRSCRFCQAGMIYRPLRDRSVANLISLAEKSLASTGYEDVSLLSLSTGDYGGIDHLMRAVMSRCEGENISVSFPSLRVGTLTPELMSLVKKVRKTGFTLAVEAGSRRLREVINKDIADDQIADTISEAFELGWQVIKLYFMVGLPTETDADLEQLVSLVKDLRKIAWKKRRGAKLNVSVACFIPKPHTPFQWAGQLDLEQSRCRIRWVQDRLRLSGIQVKWQNPEVSALEGLWSRGDRKLSRLLEAAYRTGCRLDGWSDQFRFDFWGQAMEQAGIDPQAYTARQRGFDEPLPWDHIDVGVKKSFLLSEWEKAIRGELTADCRTGQCHGCGVCNFETLSPRVADSKSFEPVASCDQPSETPAGEKVYAISYSRRVEAAYFGHLELVNIFLRAIRRARIHIKYSQGYHPMPKAAFHDPLPMGMESVCETFYLTVLGDMDSAVIQERINQQLPEGLTVFRCVEAVGNARPEKVRTRSYFVQLKEGYGFFDEKRLIFFKQSQSMIFYKKSSKGKTNSIDLKRAVQKIDLQSSVELWLVLANEPGLNVRPTEAMEAIFGLTPLQIKQASVVKLPSETEMRSSQINAAICSSS